MKIKVSIHLGIYGIHTALLDQDKYSGAPVGAVVGGQIVKVELIDEVNDHEIQSNPADAYNIGLTEVHNRAFRPHLDGNIKRVELRLEGTKPKSIHHHPASFSTLELLDNMAASIPRDKMGRVIINVDGHRFQREEIRSMENNFIKRVWFAIAGNGEGGEAGEKSANEENIDLVSLHKIIAQMHPKRREAQLVTEPQGTIIHKHDHRVIPEVIEALEAEVKRGQYVVSDQGEVTIWVEGKEYRKRIISGDQRAWFAWLDL